MTEPVRDRPQELAPCCEPTVALVSATLRVSACPVCRTEYFPTVSPAYTAPELVAARPGLDLREGEVPEPGARVSRVRVRDPEPAEVAAVRQLLCELRPETDGPLGWGPYDEPPRDVKPAPPIRVQNGAGACDIPRGAFVRPPVELLSLVRKRIDRVAHADPHLGAVLVYLQRRGTLKHGYGALCVGVGYATADSARLERWHADPSRAWDRARVWGARQIERAEAAWRATAEAVGPGA